MGRRLAVIQTPSPSETSWANAITVRAGENRIPVFDLRGGTIPDLFDGEQDQVVLVTTPDVAEAACAPTAWLVIRDTPATARRIFAEATGDPIESRTVATLGSHRLALAETVADWTSASVIDASQLTADVPFLGTVQRTTDSPTAWPQSEMGALSVFESGATAQWPLSLFYFPKGDKVEGGTSDIDLTGRARLLMFGPYIYLPPGLWTIDVRFEIDPEHREVPLRMEWGSGEDYVEASEHLSQPGTYVITLERTWATAEAAQFRLWLEQARFQGHLRIIDCTVRGSRPLLSIPVTSADLDKRKAQQNSA